MTESRYECSWCREISVDGEGVPPVSVCTGQPSHSAHDWIPNLTAPGSRIPFESERRLHDERILTHV